MDGRWETKVKPNFSELIRVLDPLALRDQLYSRNLITEEDFDCLSSLSSRREMSRRLVVNILPRRGRTAYDRFLKALRSTTGQEHVADEILEPDEKVGNVLRPAFEKEKSREMKILRKELAATKLALFDEKLTNAGFRQKTGYGNGLRWNMVEPALPVVCWPSRCVAEIDGMIHVGWEDTIYWLRDGHWETRKMGFKIGSVFECGEKRYVMEGGGWWAGNRCKRVYEWKSEKELVLINCIPDKYQLYGRSAIGHDDKIYLAGGKWGCNRVDCYDVSKAEWKVITGMKKSRECCSLAVIGNKLYVGGGAGSKDVECFLMDEERWIDVDPTAREWCELLAWNGKLVATGGWECSDVVELFDDVSGKWLPLPSLSKGRHWHGACRTSDDRFFVVGGYDSGNSFEYLKLG